MTWKYQHEESRQTPASKRHIGVTFAPKVLCGFQVGLRLQLQSHLGGTYLAPGLAGDTHEPASLTSETPGCTAPTPLLKTLLKAT